MEESSLWEGVSCSPIQEIHRILWNPKVYLTFTRARHLSVARGKWIQSMLSHPIPVRSIATLSFLVKLCSTNGLVFFRFSSPTCFMHFSSPSYVPYNPRISYFFISSIQHYLLRTTNDKVLSIFSFCLPSVTSFHFEQCVFRSNLFSNNFSSCSYRSLRFQVSHTLKNEKLRLCIF
jgi:hypothetical protein